MIVLFLLHYCTSTAGTYILPCCILSPYSRVSRVSNRKQARRPLPRVLLAGPSPQSRGKTLAILPVPTSAVPFAQLSDVNGHWAAPHTGDIGQRQWEKWRPNTKRPKQPHWPCDPRDSPPRYLDLVFGGTERAIVSNARTRQSIRRDR